MKTKIVKKEEYTKEDIQQAIIEMEALCFNSEIKSHNKEGLEESLEILKFQPDQEDAAQCILEDWVQEIETDWYFRANKTEEELEHLSHVYHKELGLTLLSSISSDICNNLDTTGFVTGWGLAKGLNLKDAMTLETIYFKSIRA